MDAKQAYEDLSGEYDADVMRAYLAAGYIPSAGMALGLIEEVEARERLLDEQAAEVARLTADVAGLEAKLIQAQAAGEAKDAKIRQLEGSM